jgi:hypothetical protein
MPHTVYFYQGEKLFLSGKKIISIREENYFHQGRNLFLSGRKFTAVEVEKIMMTYIGDAAKKTLTAIMNSLHSSGNENHDSMHSHRSL